MTPNRHYAKQQVGRKSALTIKNFWRVVTDIIRTLDSSLGNVNAADYMQDKKTKTNRGTLSSAPNSDRNLKIRHILETRTAAHHPHWSQHEKEHSLYCFFVSVCYCIFTAAARMTKRINHSARKARLINYPWINKSLQGETGAVNWVSPKDPLLSVSLSVSINSLSHSHPPPLILFPFSLQNLWEKWRTKL